MLCLLLLKLLILKSMTKTKILLVGDICISQEYPRMGEKLKKVIGLHDIVSCNLEGPVHVLDTRQVRKTGPSLMQSEKAIYILKNLGFDIFSISNNHIMDYGIEALKKTLETVGRESCVGAGLNEESTYKALVKSTNGMKIGFISLAEWGFGALDDMSENGFAWINHPDVSKLVRDTKKEVDYLIVQAHAGIEDIELPLPIWRNKYKELIDWGADLIIGHHPHVPQGWEIYKNSKIYYSLGNFYMTNRETKAENNYMVSVTLCRDEVKLDVIPITRRGNSIDVSSDNGFVSYLRSISKDIIGNRYEYLINNLSNKLWEERYKNFYLIAMNRISFDSPLRNNLKILKELIQNRAINRGFLLHNISIESHRYVVERYLKLSYVSD